MSEMWGVLELMGHVRVAGRITEEERFGGKLGRIDIPKRPEAGCPFCAGTGHSPTVDGPCVHCSSQFTTQFFNAASIYRLTPTDEATARTVAAASIIEPVHAWELPRPALVHREADDGDGEN